MIDYSQPNLIEVAAVKRAGRWTPRRKAFLLLALKRGELTIADAKAEFNLDVEEIDSWMRLQRQAGQPGLRASKLQTYRW